jgi:hypothetical protein
MMLLPEAVFISAIFTSGFTNALQANESPTPCLGAARELSRTLRQSDLLVAGWDNDSLLYSALWGNGAKRFDVPATATDNGPRTISLLDDDLARVRYSGGRVFFLGVLDMREAVWRPYLGNRCHLPYDALDGIRSCARPVAKLACSESNEVLWQLSFDCYKPYPVWLYTVP